MSPASVELPAVTAFVRQHTHDIRNHLNSFDLEAALLAELVSDAEAAEGVARLRTQIRNLATELKSLAGKFSVGEAHRAPIAAQELFLIWQDQAAALGLDSIRWETALGEERISVDVAGVSAALEELLVNARQFTGTRGLAAGAARRGDQVEFELRETKREPVDPSSWGGKPFISTKRGGYGLGLWQVKQIIEASGGEVVRAFLPNGTLVTQLIFPLA